MSRITKLFTLGVIMVLVLSLALPGLQRQLKPTKTFGLKNGITLKVKAPANYKGACPHTFIFEGTIVFGGPARISYLFKRSDGVSTRPITGMYVKGGVKKVQMKWTISKTYSGWVELYATIGKNKMVPKRANFSLRCLAKVTKPILKPLKPVVRAKVNGGVSIIVRPTRTLLLPSIRLYKSGNPLPGQKVVVDGTTISEQSKGHYRQEIPGYSARAGKMVNVSIGPKLRPLQPSRTTMKIGASAKTGRLLSFTAPAANARIKLATIKALTISWTPSLKPVNLYIYDITGGSAGPKAFEKQNAGGGKVTVPAKAFKVNKQYGIYISQTMGNFSFKGKVAPGSKLILRQSVGRYFYTK